jgi:hypothetical protein
MTLEPIMIKGFNSNGKASTRFHRSGSIFFNPSLENTTKATFTKKTLRSKISSCQLEIIKCELPQSRSNFKLLFKFGKG